VGLPSSSQIRHLPLHDLHLKLGAKVDLFGQWEVPIYYTSILAEHDAVRNRAGLFDISHMGEFLIRGKGAKEFLQKVLPRDVYKLGFGKALYMPLLRDDGTMIDDIILYRMNPDTFLLIVNAGNVDKDFAWLKQCQGTLYDQVQGSFSLSNETECKGLLALQGPFSASIVEKAFGKAATELKYYRFQEFRTGIISRTGYTGEDGFEIMVDQKELPDIWNQLMSAGRSDGLVPVGFGSRDTLRLEASMLLYGHDMKDETTPLEAGIDWAVDFNKDAFIGRDALLKQKGEGVSQKMVGIEMVERGIPREGYTICVGDEKVGQVTSGCYSPTLKKNIGLGYVNSKWLAIGTDLKVMIRDRAVQAKVTTLPFYKRKKVEVL